VIYLLVMPVGRDAIENYHLLLLLSGGYTMKKYSHEPHSGRGRQNQGP
jgi:hypothetical protein